MKLEKEAGNMDNDEEKLSKMMQNLTNRFQNLNISLQKLDDVKFAVDSFNASKMPKSPVVSKIELPTKNQNNQNLMVLSLN